MPRGSRFAGLVVLSLGLYSVDPGATNRAWRFSPGLP